MGCNMTDLRGLLCFLDRVVSLRGVAVRFVCFWGHGLCGGEVALKSLNEIRQQSRLCV